MAAQMIYHRRSGVDNTPPWKRRRVPKAGSGPVDPPRGRSHHGKCVRSVYPKPGVVLFYVRPIRRAWGDVLR